MACRFEVTLPLWNRAGIVVARNALDDVDKLEQQLSVFRESSEVSYLNRRAAAEPVNVESSLFELLLLCQELSHDTEGAFDITSGPLTRCWGFLKRDSRLPSPDELERARQLVGRDKLLLDAASRTVRFRSAGTEINLGSIGKGYALDRAAAMMAQSGMRPTALLNAGSSSIRAIGSGGAGSPGWLLGLGHPSNKTRRLALLRMRDCALSTSGSEEQSFVHDGRRYGHIIDPRSGVPAEDVISVSVIAQSTAITDALATAFYVGGRRLAEAYCALHPDVLVIMLECHSQTPVVIGSSRGCEVEVFRDPR